jgi:hypothetical protein
LKRKHDHFRAPSDKTDEINCVIDNCGYKAEDSEEDTVLHKWIDLQNDSIAAPGLDDSIPCVEEKPKISLSPSSIKPCVENDIVNNAQLRKDNPRNTQEED